MSTSDVIEVLQFVFGFLQQKGQHDNDSGKKMSETQKAALEAK